MPFVEADGLGVILGACEATGVSAVSPLPFESPLIVEVDDDRPKVCVRGARCVSLSSRGRTCQPLPLKDSPPHMHKGGVTLFLSEGVARNGGKIGRPTEHTFGKLPGHDGGLRAKVSRAERRDRNPGCRPRCVEARLPARIQKSTWKVPNKSPEAHEISVTQPNRATEHTHVRGQPQESPVLT